MPYRAIRCLLACTFVLSVLASGLPARTRAYAAAPTPPPAFSPVVARVYFSTRAQLEQLAAQLDIWEVHADAGYLVAQLSPAAQADLAARGYRVELDPALTALLAAPLKSLPGQATGIPGFPCYRTVEETYASIDSLVASYPELAAKVDIGSSWLRASQGAPAGYDLWALVLTQHRRPGPKPRFFLLAEIHARELTTAETAMRLAEYLVQNYGVDPGVTALLDFYEIHIVPMANPDGRKEAETGLSWRKNVNNTDGCSLYPGYGTDLNRNSSFHWGGPGSSSNPCDDVYHGSAAASEPETRAIQNYVAGIFPDVRGPGINDPSPLDAAGLFITLHSYSQLVLWPWGDTTNLSPNSAQLSNLGRKFAYFNGYYPEQSDSLYPTTGATDDWAYGTLGTAAYTFEMGNAFFEACSSFTATTYPSNRNALLYAIQASRRPYQLSFGPDVLSVSVSPPFQVNSHFFVTLNAAADSARYSTADPLVNQPNRNIAAARFSLDAPAWISGTLTAPMTAVDGSFDSTHENLQAVLDITSLSRSRHTVFVESQDASGNWGVFGAAYLDLRRSLALEAAPSYRVGLPGQVVTQTISLKNTGIFSDSYHLSLSGDLWTTHAPSQVGLLSPGASAGFPITVTVPITAAPGAADAFTLRAASQTSPTIAASITITTKVPVYQAVLGRPVSVKTAAPGRTASYTLILTSTGNVTTTFQASVGENRWPSTLQPASFPLGPGQSQPLSVGVTVPLTATKGMTDTLRFQVFTPAAPAVVYTASFTTTAGDRVALGLSPLSQARRAAPGATVPYTFTVTNRGSLTDTYTVATLGSSWPAQSAAHLTLAPDAAASLVVDVAVPKVAVSGSQDQLTLTLTSQTDTAVHQSAVMTTTAYLYRVFFPWMTNK